jgi:fumarate reductase (CoM/CoB) subunit B
VVAIEGLTSFSGPRSLAIDAVRFGPEIGHVRDNIMKCTTCWRCGDVCPARIPLPERILQIRRDIFQKELVLGGHARILENIDRYRRSVEPALKRPSPRGPADGKVLYFPGCIAENRLPAIYNANVSLLEKTKAPFRLPERWSCCGAPLEKVGDWERVRELREENLLAFDKYETLVTSCPGCTTHFIQNYSLKPLHTIEYLYEAVGPRKLSFETPKRKLRVALHQPCHLSRTVGPHAIDYAVEILQRVPGIKLVEIEDADRCCGGGGGVVAGYPEVALSLARAKVRSALEAKADLLVAPCPFCVMNLSRAGGMEIMDYTAFLSSHLK